MARVLPSFEHRDAQISMAEAIGDRIARGETAVIEAPTGVGKTLAYLVPALLSHKRVVVSTNTKNLQDQIVEKDLPMVARALAEAGIRLIRGDDEDGDRRFALMKGRANYLCLDRLDKRRVQQTFDFENGDLLGEIATWSRSTPRGDRAELTGLPERSSLWDELDARSERCTGARCPRYEECFVVRMRREAEAADLVVVNHHLLFADLAMKARARLVAGRTFGEVIPRADVLILDEAHAVEEIAAEYFGGSASSGKLERLEQDLRAHPALAVEANRAVSAAGKVFGALPRDEGRIRISNAPHRAIDAARRLLPAALDALAELADQLGRAQTIDAESLADRARALADGLRFVLSAEDPDYVYWIERDPRRATLGASPIEVGHLLETHLFEQFDSAILTSATLSADRDCGYFRRTIGAPADARELLLDSPFDYASRAALYLPADAPDPSAFDAADRIAALGRALIELVGGGALFLFTSHRMMRSVHARLAGVLPYPVLLQGDRPRHHLLAEFIQRSPAVLFATASFWEGVDVPGDPLRLVLIDRLPFDPPTDPLVVARSERCASEGKNAFVELQLPRAILRLKQGFGRLLRHRGDRGVVAILDRRIKTKSYGRRFLDALPEARPIHDLEALRAWWEA